MSIGSVQANFDRLIAESTDEFQQLRREAAEAKLYYLRDTHSPEEFKKFVDEELHRAKSVIIESELSFKDIVRTVKRKISKLLRRRASEDDCAKGTTIHHKVN